MSVPANAASRQRWLTLEAFRRAGFHPIGLLNEPTAAAVEFAHHHLRELGKKSPKRYVVVYDLGGGTFDTSAVSLEGRRFELLAAEGIARLGGDDFDELVLDRRVRRARRSRTSRDPGGARARARGEGDAARRVEEAARRSRRLGTAPRRSTSPSSTRAASR